VTSSPQQFHHDAAPPPIAHPHTYYHQQHTSALASPGIAGYMNGIDRTPLGSPHDARVTPPHPSQPPLHRQSSTPGMDALADLASMQHVQQTVRQQAQRPSIRYVCAELRVNSGFVELFRHLPH